MHDIMMLWLGHQREARRIKALPVASWINLYQNATLIMGFDFLHVDKNWACPPSASGSYGTKNGWILKSLKSSIG